MATLHVTAQQAAGMHIIVLFIGIAFLIALASLGWHISGVLDSHMEELGKRDAEASFPFLFTPPEEVAKYRKAASDKAKETDV